MGLESPRGHAPGLRPARAGLAGFALPPQHGAVPLRLRTPAAADDGPAREPGTAAGGGARLLARLDDRRHGGDRPHPAPAGGTSLGPLRGGALPRPVRSQLLAHAGPCRRPDDRSLAGAAALLLPRELSRGADALSTPRLFAGACMLLGSVLIKPTAALHGAPLVLGWWLVDRRSALRLAITTTALGCAALAALQWLTSGGFLWVNRLWLVHSRVPGQASRILLSFVAVTWPVLALTGSGGAAGVALGFQAPEGRLAAPRRRRPCGRADDGETGRVLELSHPAVRGSRAAGRLLVREACQARQLGADTRWSPTCAAGLPALALASTHPFPLPTAADAETARAFYRHVLELHRLAPGPMLVSRPDLLYFLAKQPEEVDGASGAIRYSSRPGR